MQLLAGGVHKRGGSVPLFVPSCFGSGLLGPVCCVVVIVLLYFAPSETFKCFVSTNIVAALALLLFVLEVFLGLESMLRCVVVLYVLCWCACEACLQLQQLPLHCLWHLLKICCKV